MAKRKPVSARTRDFTGSPRAIRKMPTVATVAAMPAGRATEPSAEPWAGTPPEKGTRRSKNFPPVSRSSRSSTPATSPARPATRVRPSAPGKHVDAVPLGDLQRRIQGVIDRKGGIEILQLSGGEPTLHPQFFELLAWARANPGIDYLLLNTNGVRIANDRGFAERAESQLRLRRAPALFAIRWRPARRPALSPRRRLARNSPARRRTLRGNEPPGHPRDDGDAG